MQEREEQLKIQERGSPSREYCLRVPGAHRGPWGLGVCPGVATWAGPHCSYFLPGDLCASV